MTEREREVIALPAEPITRAFVRLEIHFRDGAIYCPRWAADDERAPQWRGAYASSAPPGFALLRDSRPMYQVGLLAGTDLGKALIAEHGDIISAVAVEMAL
jgi:hypothetical protein